MKPYSPTHSLSELDAGDLVRSHESPVAVKQDVLASVNAMLLTTLVNIMRFGREVVISSDVNKTKTKVTRTRPREVNKGT